MPHVDSHTPGTINWVDFVSTDLDAAPTQAPAG